MCHQSLVPGNYLLADIAAIICVAASKKKNCEESQTDSYFSNDVRIFTLETVKVLTTITRLAAITARRAVMFIARMTLRMMKPGPASVLLVRGIFSERRLLRKLTIQE